MKLEPEDWLKMATPVVAAAIAYGAFTVRVAAIERATEPVQQMRIDIEVLKASMVTMSTAVTALAQDERRRRDRREP